jgi:hypothetical protein
MAGTFGVMAPALAVSLASLLIGCLWIGWLPRGEMQTQIAMTTGAGPPAAEPAAAATAEASADAQPSLAAARFGEVANELSRPAIPLSDPAGAPSAPGAAGRAVMLQREGGQGDFGGGGLGGVGLGRGESPNAKDGVERMASEQLERKLALNAPEKAAKAQADAEQLAGTKPGPGSQPESSGKSLADSDRDKAGAGIAGVRLQTAPALAAPAPTASATAGQPAAARPEGAVLAGDKKEGEPAARGGQLAAGGVAAATPASLPASLYFNPNLQTNDQGLATIEFTLPPVNSQYRLLIDALGNGRIGSRQDLITIQGEAAK